jgi:hypothetical protein
MLENLAGHLWKTLPPRKSVKLAGLKRTVHESWAVPYVGYRIGMLTNQATGLDVPTTP